TTWPVSTGASGAGGALAVTAPGVAAACCGIACCMTGAAITMGVAPALTMRTLPSASVISSSDTLDSDTRSIRVLSLRRSMLGDLQQFGEQWGAQGVAVAACAWDG